MGVFPLINYRIPALDLRILLRSILAWMATAVILLILSAFILARIGVGSAVLGYVSSAISFLAAFAAGITFGRERRNGFLIRALAAALILVVLLFTAGYLIGDKEISPSAVLSVVTFTFSGAAAGAFLSGVRRHARQKSAFRMKSKSHP